MNVLVTGAGGQVGRAMKRVGRSARFLSRDELDITDAEAVEAVLAAMAPDVVVNLAAYTDVDGAEAHPAEAHRVNAAGAATLARACEAVGAGLVHLSTDYVFDGRCGPYLPNDPANPQSQYGASKLAGEQEIRAVLPRHVICRTSWVFGQGPENFASAILRNATLNPVLKVVDDQWGGPTPSTGLAHALWRMIDQLSEDDWGTWHVAGQPWCSWYDLAKALVQRAGLPCEVQPRRTVNGERPAVRPRDSRLDCRHTYERFGVALDWRTDLDDLVRDWETTHEA